MPVHRPVPLHQLQHSVDASRDANPLVGVGAELRHHLPLRVHEHVGGGRRRCLFAEVEREGVSIGQEPHHESTPTDIAGVGIGDSQGELHRGRGVEGVATSLQDGQADIGGQWLG